MFNKKLKSFLIVLYSISISLNANAQKNAIWHIKSLPIETRWAKDVNPEKVLPEYPRPQMVRNNWTNLNGLWYYTITEKDAKVPSKFQGRILVPFPIESALSGVKTPLLPSQQLWYKRSFKKLQTSYNEKVLLHFGAVDWQTTVYINGIEVGKHEGGYTAFSYDITNALKKGENNIIIKVYDPTDQGIGPYGKQSLNPGNIYYTSSSGIWQTVWLETVPINYIKSFSLTPDIDRGVLNISVDATEGYKVEAVVSLKKTMLKTVQDDVNKIFVIPVENAKLWSPDDPFLYDLSIRLLKNGKIVDEIKSYFGMRKIAIQKDERVIDRIFLNNKCTYNLGILDQGFWPDGLYTAPTDEALAFDIKAIKAMGFNTIRKHIKIEPARWYYHADKVGILVWQDLVNPNPELPEGSKQAFEDQTKETLDQLHNYPSIITWVIFNEKWGQYDQQRITNLVKNIDPTRLVNGHSGEMLYVNNQLRSPSPNAWVDADMTDVHSYPFPRSSPLEIGKAQVLGKFGGIGVPIEGHSWDDLNQGWGYDGIVTTATMQKQYKKMIEALAILKEEGLSGSIYTQPFDVESEQNGLMTYDRLITKLPISAFRSMNATIWPTTKNYLSEFKGLIIYLPDTTNKEYTTLIREFHQGKRTKPFLRHIFMMALHNKDQHEVVSISKAYVKQIQKPYSIDDLSFLQKITKSSSDLGFKFIISNISIINDKSSLSESIIELAKRIILAEIHPRIMSAASEKDLNTLEKEIVAKYGNFGELTIWQDIAYYYYTRKDIANFVEYKLKIHSKYANSVSIYDMNNDAWLVFQYASDVILLRAALGWSRQVIEKEPTANYYDTYANLLYKAGEREEAIKMQENALALSSDNGDMNDVKKNLEKMKKGESTWQ